MKIGLTLVDKQGLWHVEASVPSRRSPKEGPSYILTSIVYPQESTSLTDLKDVTSLKSLTAQKGSIGLYLVAN